MEDKQIIELFFARDEGAISAIQEKYSNMCQSILRRILPDSRDVEECLGDVFLRLWNAIPPLRPLSLKAYTIRVARNAALDRYDHNKKSELSLAFDELSPFLPDASQNVENAANADEFKAFLNDFLRRQSKEARVFFVRRYFYGESISEIADSCRCGEGKVKSSLFRTRNNLRKAMEKEGMTI